MFEVSILEHNMADLFTKIGFKIPAVVILRYSTQFYFQISGFTISFINNRKDKQPDGQIQLFLVQHAVLWKPTEKEDVIELAMFLWSSAYANLRI